MNMFEKVMDMLPENFSIDEIAEKDGSTDKMTAIKEAAAEAGVDAEKLKGLLPALAEKSGLDGEGSLMDKLTGDDGLLGKVTGFLDRDGDGNPINDITNMAKGFFKK